MMYSRFPILFLALNLVWCGASTAAPAGNGQMPPLPVAAMTVEAGDVAMEYVYPARISGSRYVEVRARVQGILLEQNYVEGQPVEQGQVLYRIDPAPYEAVANRAAAQLKMEQARLRQAQRDWQRVEALYKGKAVSKQEYDQTLSELELAEAGVAAAKANLHEASINLDYTAVKAAISGVAGIRHQDVGALVGSEKDNSLLTTITQLDPVYVDYSIPDREAAAIRQALASGKLRVQNAGPLKARIQLADQQFYAQEGAVDYTDTHVDPATGTLRARAVFANPDGALLPGQFVRVMISGLIRPDVFVVPQKAVMQMGETAFVYVIEDGKAVFRPVQLAGRQGENWLVEGGLKNGEQIIVGNLIKVRPGMGVMPLPPSDAQQPTAKREG